MNGIVKMILGSINRPVFFLLLSVKKHRTEHDTLLCNNIPPGEQRQSAKVASKTRRSLKRLNLPVPVAGEGRAGLKKALSRLTVWW